MSSSGRASALGAIERLEFLERSGSPCPSAHCEGCTLIGFVCAPIAIRRLSFLRTPGCFKLGKVFGPAVERATGDQARDCATKFKWDTYVHERVIRRMLYYLAHFVLAAAALLVSSQIWYTAGCSDGFGPSAGPGDPSYEQQLGAVPRMEIAEAVRITRGVCHRWLESV